MKGQQTDLFTEEESYVKGTLIVSIFYNEDNMYSVVRIRVSDTNIANAEKEMVVTGHFPSMQEEDTYVFFGKVKEHPRFGPQFISERFKKELPQTSHGIIHYLSSDLFNGVAIKTAEKIVYTLG